MAMPAFGFEMMDHLDHVEYPVTREDLVVACNKMSHVPKEDREWFADTLPEGNYNSADDVRKALGFLI